MMRRKWLFWLPEERENSSSAPHSHAETEACREWTPFLTALFDGEADEEGALRARRHLLVCERCARAWLDWNQTRSLLINHSAPPPPPSLLWRIRLACRLGHPAPSEPAMLPVPELSAQIFARTSRKNNKPAFGFASFLSMPRALRSNAPFMGAVAMGAFVLFVARDSLVFSPPPAPLVANSPVTLRGVTRPQAQPRARVVSVTRADKGKVRLASPRASGESNIRSDAPRTVPVVAPRQPDNSERSSLASLDRARHERESLASSPVRLASFDSSQPLPMLPAPRPIVVATKEPTPKRQVVRAPRLARLPRIAPRPVASAPQVAPPVMLASFDTDIESAAVPEPTSAPVTRRRGGRVLLASAPLPTAPLRISAPHALPITVSQPPASDDAGLDELDSTVLEYRSTFADDTSDFSSDSD
ncbi:hypothetical protein IAD21_01851 [Abditibacteriota bacterium]|nr:hypothetical protein IAD21_01851 [Abditibacteriota bacterium]